MNQFLSGLTGRQAFWSSFIFLLVLPWIPLFAEWGLTGDVRPSSWQIFAALDALGLGVSSRNEALFGLGVLLAILFSLAYGGILSMENVDGAEPGVGFNSEFWRLVTMIVSIAMFLAHLGERYNRHVYDEEPFFQF
jgi:hypothetical protein